MNKDLQRNPGRRSIQVRDWQHDIGCWCRKLPHKDLRNGCENKCDREGSHCLERIPVYKNCTDRLYNWLDRHNWFRLLVILCTVRWCRKDATRTAVVVARHLARLNFPNQNTISFKIWRWKGNHNAKSQSNQSLTNVNKVFLVKRISLSSFFKKKGEANTHRLISWRKNFVWRSYRQLERVDNYQRHCQCSQQRNYKSGNDWVLCILNWSHKFPGKDLRISDWRKRYSMGNRSQECIPVDSWESCQSCWAYNHTGLVPKRLGIANWAHRALECKD